MTTETNQSDLVAPILRSPRLVQLAREIQTVLADEQRRRDRFVDEVAEGRKAEFINGEVVVHSPVRLRHAQVSQRLFRLLDAHVGAAGLGFVGFEKVMVSLTRNDYEPDVCYFARESADRFAPDQARLPAPDFVAEVLSDSTVAIDRGVKFEDYGAHGVREYCVVDPEAEVVEQHVLAEGQYALRLKVGDGPIESTAVPGFAIPVRALFDDAIGLEALRVIVALRSGR